MRTTRNHYEILGLPRSASLGQIKRRYRELVRKYHPDVATDKVTAHRLFIQITQAYEALRDPVTRRAYDESLDQEIRRTASATSPSATSAAASSSDNRTVAQLIKDAQWSFIQKRLHEATSLCKEALNRDPRNARAHVILGDVYRAQGKMNSATRAYSYALQYNPHDRETEKKLTSLLGKQIKAEAPRHREPVSGTTSFALQNMIGWGVVFLLIMLINVYPGEPIPWLKRYIPPVDMWSWNLVGLMAAASAVVGVLLSINNLVNHPDEELVFDGSDGNWAVVPTGLLLLIGSGFFFVGAALFYILVGAIQSSLSKSLMAVFACVAGVVVLASLMYDPQARNQVLLFGGNIGFLSMLVGWYVGASLKPLSEY